MDRKKKLNEKDLKNGENKPCMILHIPHCYSPLSSAMSAAFVAGWLLLFSSVSAEHPQRMMYMMLLMLMLMLLTMMTVYL